VLLWLSVWVSRYQKDKIGLRLNEARVWGCSGISWTICKQSAPHSRQTTTPAPHHSIFTGHMLFLTLSQQCQSTEGKLELLKYAENASVLVMDVACTVAIPLWRKRYDAVKLNATH